MKAPEEIELNTCTFSDIGLFDIDEEEVTYIRKDALLEWLQQGFDWIKNPVISVQQIIDKLNSM